jgi:hypothetical protein
MFFGIIIRMYFAPGEHPPPHFHAYYNEYKAIVDIRTGDIIEGSLPWGHGHGYRHFDDCPERLWVKKYRDSGGRIESPTAFR